MNEQRRRILEGSKRMYYKGRDHQPEKGVAHSRHAISGYLFQSTDAPVNYTLRALLDRSVAVAGPDELG